MSILLAALLLASPASDEGNFDASYVCKVYAKDGTSRDIPVKFGLKAFELREIEFTDGGSTAAEKYDKGRVTENKITVYVTPPPEKQGFPYRTTSLVYQFDFTDMRFGEGAVRIDRIVEPRPNVVTSHSIQATGICTIIIPKAAS